MSVIGKRFAKVKFVFCREKTHFRHEFVMEPVL